MDTSNTFLTQEIKQSLDDSSPSKKNKDKSKMKNEDFTMTIGNYQTEDVNHQEEIIDVGGSFNQNIPDDYEDNDFTIHFNIKSLFEYLGFLEDDNLFKIYLVDEEELNKKEQFAQTGINIHNMFNMINEVENSTMDLTKSLE